MKTMKALVTGAAGFVGSHLCDELLAHGVSVVGVDDLSFGARENVPNGVTFVEASIVDLPDDPPWMDGVEVVFHEAAIARTAWTISWPEASNRVNVDGTLRVLELARRHGVRRFVHASSNILYSARSPYKVQKQAAEEYVLAYGELYGLSTIALRYANVYGTLRQSERGEAPNVLAAMRRARREQGKVFVTGVGDQTRDFIHVTDAARATYLASLEHVSGWFDICSGQQHTILRCAQAFGCPIEHLPERAADAPELIQDPQAARDRLGFVTQVSFEQGLANYATAGHVLEVPAATG